MIVALAGRRVDAEGQEEPRFPANPEAVEVVRQRIGKELQRLQATALVCSAACGTDLLALEEAGRLGLRRRVILPFARERFRATSVTDRPGDWGPIYDAVMDDVQARGDLVVLAEESSKVYIEANHRIIEEALALGRMLQDGVTAVRVWEGRSRGAGDVTEEFGLYAQARGVPVADVMTR